MRRRQNSGIFLKRIISLRVVHWFSGW